MLRFAIAAVFGALSLTACAQPAPPAPAAKAPAAASARATPAANGPAEQAVRAVTNARIALEAAGAALDDVISWTILLHQDADLGAAYGAVAPLLAREGAPPLVTAALVAGLAVPGALIEVSAIAAVIRD